MPEENKTDKLSNLDLDLSKWSDDNWLKIRKEFITILRRKGISSEIAEDIADETISRIWEKRENAVRKENSYWWSLGFLKNVIKENWKKIKRTRNEVEIDILDQTQASSNVKNSKDFFIIEEEQKKNAAREICLKECIQKLPAEKRQLYYDYFIESGANKALREEIAKRLGIKDGALRKRIHDIKKVITKCVKSCVKKNKY